MAKEYQIWQHQLVHLEWQLPYLVQDHMAAITGSPVKSPTFCVSHLHFSLFSSSPAFAFESQAFFSSWSKVKLGQAGM